MKRTVTYLIENVIGFVLLIRNTLFIQVIIVSALESN